jgi:hypothetical protein
MSAEILQFKSNQKERHGVGPAHCLGCGAKWNAVVPCGSTFIECPECKADKGILDYPYMAKAGGMVWQCNCGNQLFYLTEEGTLCPNCGKLQVFP